MSDVDPNWGQISAAKEAQRRRAAALPPLEKLKALDRLRERRNQIYRAVRVFDEAEIARIIETRLAGARRRELEGDPRASLELRALQLLQEGIDDHGQARARLADLSVDTQAVSLLLWMWFRHHQELLRNPPGRSRESTSPRQPRKPFAADVGALGARLNSDREFWILLRFLESRPDHGLVPTAYVGQGKGWDFEMVEGLSGARWLVEVTEATTTEQVEERLERSQRQGDEPDLTWFGDEPERIVAGVCAATIRRKARQATQGGKAESRAQPGTRTMLLLYPNIDEQRVLISEGPWSQVAQRIDEALDDQVVAAFDQLWLVRDSSEPLALGGGLPVPALVRSRDESARRASPLDE